MSENQNTPTPAAPEKGYDELLRQAVAVIDASRQNAARQISTAIAAAHWNMGQLLHEKKVDSEHGNGVVKRLSVDLKEKYPTMGLSPRNLWDMKRFYLRFRNSDVKVRQAVALLPWGHMLRLLRGDGEYTDDDILFYAEETLRKGWTREMLESALAMRLHKQKGISAPSDNNFPATLPETQAQYANQVFRGTYNLSFLGATQPMLELELERRLVEKVKLFLLELGRGFTFISNQHELEYNGKRSRVDMLLYHRGLRCLVAIDLKIGEFKPEYAGKMNYYLSLLDKLERGEGENRSIGIILCAAKDRVDVEMALEDMGKPIGVADYQLVVAKEELKKVIESEMKAFENDNKDGENNKQ